MEYDNIYEAIFIEKKSNMCKKKRQVIVCIPTKTTNFLC